jgi:hypothetical protein
MLLRKQMPHRANFHSCLANVIHVKVAINEIKFSSLKSTFFFELSTGRWQLGLGSLQRSAGCLGLQQIGDVGPTRGRGLASIGTDTRECVAVLYSGPGGGECAASGGCVPEMISCSGLTCSQTHAFRISCHNWSAEQSSRRRTASSAASSRVWLAQPLEL